MRPKNEMGRGAHSRLSGDGAHERSECPSGSGRQALSRRFGGVACHPGQARRQAGIEANEVLDRGCQWERGKARVLGLLCLLEFLTLPKNDKKKVI